LRRIAAVVLFVLCAAMPALAQDWPGKTVRVIVPFGAGATPDIIARLIADKLQQKLGQNFIVENKPGASGMTGTDTVAKAEPDGYTIGISIGGPLAINTLLFSKMPYDPFRDIALITILTTQPSALAVPANLGVNTVAELVALIKRTPANTISAPSATARSRISPWRRSRSRAARSWCTFPTAPRRRR
jgi:tripartite-type tricarboxylate transporter receptor subunit TctC